MSTLETFRWPHALLHVTKGNFLPLRGRILNLEMQKVWTGTLVAPTQINGIIKNVLTGQTRSFSRRSGFRRIGTESRTLLDVFLGCWCDSLKLFHGC